LALSWEGLWQLVCQREAGSYNSSQHLCLLACPLVQRLLPGFAAARLAWILLLTLDEVYAGSARIQGGHCYVSPRM